MKPIQKKTLLHPGQSFSLEDNHLDYFNVPWHMHSEYELLYVCKSSGKRYVGDSIENFEKGDLVLMGPNLPHCWLNDDLDKCRGKFFDARYKVIHFSEKFLGENFFSIPEMTDINQLLSNAARGVHFTGEIVAKTNNRMYKMLKQEPLDRLITFLRILKDLSEWEEVRYLSSRGFVENLITVSDESIKTAQQYITENFKKDINLREISTLTGMTKTSFCRYFKRKTSKSFIRYVNEFRIGYACKLIKNTNLSFSEIGFESGFENQSYFYRQFRELKGLTPKEYREKHRITVLY